MSPIDKVLSALREHGKNPRRSGKGWLALCPAHADHNPSLNINEGEDGKVLLKCFSCQSPVETIVERIGLTVGDLFREGQPFGTSRKALAPKGTTHRTMAKEKESKIFPTVEAAISYITGKCGGSFFKWEYRNSLGEIVAFALRFDLEGKNKLFRPVSRKGEGWVVKAPMSPRPLYNLAEVRVSESPILFVEGEKCAEIARGLGLIATTTFGGANAPHLTDLKPLEGKEVWLIPDNDPAGKGYVEKVLGILGQLVSPPKVKVIRLPNLEEGEDLEQFCQNCRSQGRDEEATRQEILRLAEQAPYHNWSAKEEAQVAVLKTCRASEVKIRPVEWLWKPYIPFGFLTLVSGLPKQGKSQIVCNLAAIASKGGQLPDGSIAPRCEILYCSAEDNSAEVLTPRFLANDAELSAIHFPQGITHFPQGITSPKNTESAVPGTGQADPSGTEPEYWNLLHIPALENCLKENSKIRIVVIDPIGSFIGGTTNTYRDNEVRAVLEPLKRLAQEKKLAVLLICHLGKSRHPNADQNILGSTAFHGLARGSLHVQADSHDPEKKLFLSGNVNLSKIPPAWRVWFEEVRFPSEEGVVETSRVCWSHEPIAGLCADHYYRPEANEFARRGPKPNKLEEAKDWLQNFLTEGPKRQTVIEEESDKIGISESTLKRAKKELGCKAYREGGVWYWRRPQGHKEPEPLEPLDEKALEIPMNLQEDQQGENLILLEPDQVFPVSDSNGLPNCQAEQATETDGPEKLFKATETDGPEKLFAGRTLFEDFSDQRLPD